MTADEAPRWAVDLMLRYQREWARVRQGPVPTMSYVGNGWFRIHDRPNGTPRRMTRRALLSSCATMEAECSPSSPSGS